MADKKDSQSDVFIGILGLIIFGFLAFVVFTKVLPAVGSFASCDTLE